MPKQKYIYIIPPQNIKPQNMKCDLTNDVSIKINGNEKATKLMGMYIYENLSWKHHLSQMNKKMSKALFSIKQVKRVYH